jgi:ADP-heptose:LPS heptosyltransferase
MEIPLLRRLKKQNPLRPLIVVGTNRNGGLALLRYESCIDRIIELPICSGRLSTITSMFMLALSEPTWGRESEIYLPVYSLDSETFWFLSWMKKLRKLGFVTAQFERDPKSSARRLPDHRVGYDSSLHDIENHFKLRSWNEPYDAHERICDTSRLPPIDFQNSLSVLKGRRFWLFQTGAGRGTTHKILRPEALATLISRLSEKYPDILPILIGGKSERGFAEEVSSLLKTSHHNVAGETSMANLIDLIRCAVGVTSYDSGVMHLAIWLGTPAFSIFGPTDPRRNGPPSDSKYVAYRETFQGCYDPCHIPLAKDCPLHFRCIKGPDLKKLEDSFVSFLSKCLS